jgi:hypothetical protein
VLLDGFLQRLQHHAGLNHGGALHRVDVLDRAHPLHRQDHFGGRGIGAVNETGEAALGHHGNAMVMAPAQHTRDLLGGSRAHQRLRLQIVPAQRAGGSLGDFGSVQHAAFADDSGEGIDHRHGGLLRSSLRSGAAPCASSPARIARRILRRGGAAGLDAEAVGDLGPVHFRIVQVHHR